MSRLFTLALILYACVTRAAALPETPRPGTIVLLPVDDRPAVAQFAQMIAAIAGHEVVIPPVEMLGRFTRPGDTDGLERWLRGFDYSRVDALIISVDMLAYGGLVASRAYRVSTEGALRSLEFFRWFRRLHPKIPVYAFSVIMRVAPTASAESRPWREDLARWSELMDRAPKTGDLKLQAELGELERRLDPELIEGYRMARKRDLQINLAMIELYKAGQVDALILLQDDARPYGLHRADQGVVTARLKELQLENRVRVYNGADEGSLSLISRAILEKYRSPVKAFTVFSSKRSRKVVAPFEDHPLEFTVENQIHAAGSLPAANSKGADYLLYINAPQTNEDEFQSFLDSMVRDLKAGRTVALADVLFPSPHFSGADERIIRRLESENLCDRLAGYAAWNTAGNTLGTAIPQANMRVLSRKIANAHPEQAARALAAQLEFLLHRFAGDYLYHDVVRPGINRKLRAQADTPTDEFTLELYEQVNGQVVRELKPLVEDFFVRHFRGRTYNFSGAGPEVSIRVEALRGLEIFLPWPRSFEVTIRYRMEYKLRER